MLHALLTITFVAGLVPSLAFLYFYLTRSPWKDTPISRGLAWLMGVIAVTYTISLFSLFWPDFFLRSVPGQWIRIIERAAVAVILTNMVRVLLKAQRARSEEDQ